ncbi:MAG: hypothetical protein O3A14_15915 [Cyanobacteria bacterium]|nr:hypothetical protein [Cyanobacteriota bacterium]
MNPRNCLDVYEIYRMYLFASLPETTARGKWNKFKTAMLRYVLPGLGFERADYKRKLTQDEVQNAESFMTTIWVRSMSRFEALVDAGLQMQEASPSSVNTYRSAIRQFSEWGSHEIWWPNARGASGFAQGQLCPPRAPRGQAKKPPKLMERGELVSYGLKRHQLPAALQTQMRDMESFLTAADYPLRLIDCIEETTYRNYEKSCLLMLGWFHHYHQPVIAREDLTLNLLFPIMPEAELEAMTPRQRKQFWKEQRAVIQGWLGQYRQFLRLHQKSDNPRTWLTKLEALLAIGHYQWKDHVDYKADYRKIPLLTYIREELSKVQDDIKRWSSSGLYASDQALKMPNVIPGEETALGAIRRETLEHLRYKCRPRTATRGKIRSAYALACSHQRFLMWAHLSLIPARRQKTLRTTRIATCCPVQRPESVPADGLYHPIPPDAVLSKRHDGSVAENWLCRVYAYGGQTYPGGAWLHIVRNYKTWKTHGDQVLVLPDWEFDDDQTLYELLERHLNGYWLVGNCRGSRNYDGDTPQCWQGTRGKWITHGRYTFLPKDFCLVDCTRTYWTWGYLYVMPEAGLPMEEGDFCDAFAHGALKATGKWTTPHLMRSIWATWGFTVLKTDQELRSLAYAMGMTLETMRKIYERCTPETKYEPIQNAISAHFQPSESGPVTLAQVRLQAKCLAAEERKQLMVEMMSWSD